MSVCKRLNALRTPSSACLTEFSYCSAARRERISSTSAMSPAFWRTVLTSTMRASASWFCRASASVSLASSTSTKAFCTSSTAPRTVFRNCSSVTERVACATATRASRLPPRSTV